MPGLVVLKHVCERQSGDLVLEVQRMRFVEQRAAKTIVNNSEDEQEASPAKHSLELN
jgi:hypothetical protein